MRRGIVPTYGCVVGVVLFLIAAGIAAYTWIYSYGPRAASKYRGALMVSVVILELGVLVYLLSYPSQKRKEGNKE